MNEKLNELVDLRVKLQLAEKRYDEAEVEDTLTQIEEEITQLQEEISKVEKELELEEQPAEETPADEGSEEEPRAEDEEEEKPADEESDKESDEDTEAEDEEEPTTDEVRSSKEWTKVDASNLKKMASFEERGENKMNEETRKVELEAREERGKALKEGRAITVASSDVLLPKHQSSDLATAPFRQVSTFADLTKVRNLQGGESYEAPYVISYGEGGLTEEGADYTEVETKFGKAQINKVKITAYAEISEELEKLPAADYEAEVRKGVEIALKKKLAKEQINGTGENNSFTGIMSKVAGNTAVLESDDKEIATIDQDTLNNIIFSYGGDEEVEQKGVLVLNKADLLAFSLVRNEIGDHAYKIDLANQTINTVPYVINSNCKALSSADTATGDYAMFYGIPQHYETAIFSPVEIMKSYDYKFKQGMIAYKASVFAGGNTTSYRGFMRIKKGNPSA